MNIAERSAAFCGNNIPEAGEQCDCGFTEKVRAGNITTAKRLNIIRIGTQYLKFGRTVTKRATSAAIGRITSIDSSHAPGRSVSNAIELCLIINELESR